MKPRPPIKLTRKPKIACCLIPSGVYLLCSLYDFRLGITEEEGPGMPLSSRIASVASTPSISFSPRLMSMKMRPVLGVARAFSICPLSREGSDNFVLVLLKELLLRHGDEGFIFDEEGSLFVGHNCL